MARPHLWEHADGELYWWLLRGMRAPDGAPVMPGSADVLSDGWRWALIDAVRARNAGLALRDAGVWPRPVPLPGFGLTCRGREAAGTEDLRGRVLYVVAQQTDSPRPGTAGADARLVVLAKGEPEGDPAGCTSTDPAAWDALAAVTGRSLDALAGSRPLVDGSGWLRAFKPRSEAAAWDDPGVLAAAAASIAAAPIGAATGGSHHAH